LSGDAFDREYLAYLVRDHHAELKAFRDEDKKVTDAGLKPVVDRALQVVEEHTVMVERLVAAKRAK